MRDSPYYAQAELLVRYLPALAAAECFALKGGTAINLFVRDLPRLSVDIDLAYTPLTGRERALEHIRAAMAEMAARATGLIPGLRVIATGAAEAPKQIAVAAGAQIKVEPNPVLRGTVFEPEERRLSPAAEALFGRSATVRVASGPDLYAGKLCAALDRGHPRDWFDVTLMLRQEALDDRLRQAFVVYLASHGRPMAELLAPRPRPLRDSFTREFQGMARDPITVDEMEATQALLPARLRSALTESERSFLLSVKLGEPEWDLLPIPHVRDLPALQWKLANIAQLRREPRRHAASVARLRAVLEL